MKEGNEGMECSKTGLKEAEAEGGQRKGNSGRKIRTEGH
jgi:hypothetical protein